MPNNPEPEPTAPDLDSLVNEAEDAAHRLGTMPAGHHYAEPRIEQRLEIATEARVLDATPSSDLLPSTVPGECAKCGHPATRSCVICKGALCDDCSSILDPRYCKLCLDEKDAELKKLPLKDADGVQHEGRELLPTGRYFAPRFGTLAKTISEMSMFELEGYIDQYKELIRQAETALDFRRVVLGSAQIELAQRKDAERRKLRGVRVPQPRQAAGTGAASPKTRKSVPAASLSDMMKALEMLQVLKTQQGLKNVQTSGTSVSSVQPSNSKTVVDAPTKSVTIPLRPLKRPEPQK